jgi:hypothetical protein
MKRPNHKIKNSFNSHAVIAAIAGLGSLSAAIYWINFKIHELFPVFSGLAGIRLYVIMFLFLSVLYVSGVFLVIKWMPKEDIEVILHPRSGWPQEAPWKGASTLGKPQRGYYDLFKIKIQLLFFCFFLFANILAYGFFIQTNCAHAVPSGPEMLTLRLFAF